MKTAKSQRRETISEEEEILSIITKMTRMRVIVMRRRLRVRRRKS